MDDREDILEIVTDPGRLAAVRESGLLDSPRDEVFDDLTALAADVLDASGALMTLLDEDRQFFKSARGLPAPWAARRQTPLTHSFCKYVVAGGEPLVVGDAREDPLLRENRAIDEMGVVAYLGVPLRYGGGRVIGSLSVFQATPRQWTEREVERVRALAACLEGLLAAGGRTREPAADGREEAWVSYRALVEGLPLGVVVHRDEEIRYLNPEAGRVLGLDPRQVDSGDLSLLDFVAPDERERVRLEIDRVQRDREPIPMQRYRVVAASGASRPVEAKAVPVEFRGESAVQLVFRDLTRLEESEEKFSRLFRLSPVPMTLSTFEGSRFVEVNDAFSEFVGYDRDELVDESALELGLWADEMFRKEMIDQIRRTGRAEGVEARVRRKDDEVRDVHLFGERIELDGRDHLLAITYDVTEQKALERQLERQALYDTLTGLPNRSLFRDRLEHALTRGKRDGTRVAVLYLDLDRFKVVNDTLGHAAGDRLLDQVARRVEGCHRDQDTVARLGGDEFGVLLEDVEDTGDVYRAADRLVDAFDAPVEILETDVHVTASIGIALASPDLDEPEDLLRFSDIAMYHAKEEGGTDYALFDPSRDASATRRLHRENELRRAVEREEFEVVYQPIVSLPEATMTGVEALVRWRHPDGKLLSPAKFIGLAEETGLIVPLGEQVLRAASEEAAGWSSWTGKPGPNGEPGEVFRLSVNLSPRQFREPGLVGRIEGILADAGMPPHAVQVEITEGVAVQAAGRVQRLREMGLRLAIDDFGTGYSSLEYLKDLEVDALKVDRVFVSGIPDSARDRAIVRAVLGMTREMGLTAVAEGVETDVQRESLQEMGFQLAQGFYFSRPVPGPEIEAALAG